MTTHKPATPLPYSRYVTPQETVLANALRDVLEMYCPNVQWRHGAAAQATALLRDLGEL